MLVTKHGMLRLAGDDRAGQGRAGATITLSCHAAIYINLRPLSMKMLDLGVAKL